MKFNILTMLPYVFSTVVDFDLIRDLELEMSTDSILNFYGVLKDLKDQDDQIKKDSLLCDYESKKSDDSERLPFTDERGLPENKKARIEEKSFNLKEKGVLENKFCDQIDKKESHEDVFTKIKSKSSTLAITNKDPSLVLKKPISFSNQNLPNLDKQENLKKLDGRYLEGNQVEVPIRNAAIEPINDKNVLTREILQEHEVSDLANNFTSEEMDFVKSILQDYKDVLYMYHDNEENRITLFINILNSETTLRKKTILNFNKQTDDVHFSVNRQQLSLITAVYNVETRFLVRLDDVIKDFLPQSLEICKILTNNKDDSVLKNSLIRELNSKIINDEDFYKVLENHKLQFQTSAIDDCLIIEKYNSILKEYSDCKKYYILKLKEFSTKYLYTKYHESKGICLQEIYFSALIHILNDKKFRIILILFPELNEFIEYFYTDGIQFDNLSLIFSLFTVLNYRFEFLAPIIKTEIESSLKEGSFKCYSDCKFLFYIVLQTRFFINLVAINSLVPRVPCKASVISTFVSYCAYFYPHILRKQKTNESYIQYFLLKYKIEQIYSALFIRNSSENHYSYSLIQKPKIYSSLGRDLNLTSDELKKFIDSSSLQLTFEDVKNNVKEAINNAVLNEILQYYDIARPS